MAINITSLFQDILETPEQKQQRQLAEGFARSQNAVAGLTGLATAAAPLVGTMAELQGRRTEALQRGVGGLLGRDVRSTSERLQDALSQFNPQDPRSVSQTTQMLQQMGLGPQAAQLAAMALEEQQRKEAIDLQAQAARQAIDINAGQEARAVETQAMAREQEERAIAESAFRMRAAEQAFNQAQTQEERATADRSSFRVQAARAITASDSLSPSEKQVLLGQVSAGGFDGNAADLYKIVSPEPIKVGDQILVRGSGGQWEYINDTSGPGLTTSLMSAASLQYANRPNDLAVINDAIASGAITDAKQFKDYAPLPDTAIQPGPDVEAYNIAGIEASKTASQGVDRINSILSSIYESGALTNSPAGKFSDVVERGREFLGLRDTISQIRTAFTGEKNLALIGSMPRGAASDRDVMLFSQGYPPDNASVSEMVSWLESAKVAMYRIQDYQTISEQILSKQLSNGLAPTTIGLGTKALPVLLDIDLIESREAYLQGQVNEGNISQEEAAAQFKIDLDGFYEDHQFIPSKYSR